MKHATLLRTVTAALGGLLLALGIAVTPASASPAVFFSVSNTGNNGCTEFWADGWASWHVWHDLDDPAVSVGGNAGIDQFQPACFRVVLAPQQVEFTAYAGRLVVDSHTEHIKPVNADGSQQPSQYFSFTLRGADRYGKPIQIDRVTIQICEVGYGNDTVRCGKTRTLHIDDEW